VLAQQLTTLLQWLSNQTKNKNFRKESDVTHTLQTNVAAAFAALFSAAIFVSASIAPAVNNASSMVI